MRNGTKKKKIKLRDTAFNFVCQNGNILVSEELHKAENINKYDFMARDWMDLIKSEYLTCDIMQCFMNLC